ncbi:MAG: hypothetical protein IJW18_02205 [Lachnospiraceae bacterium]|nr:hypothetical protein [Lachnospiraceae bacterium]
MNPKNIIRTLRNELMRLYPDDMSTANSKAVKILTKSIILSICYGIILIFLCDGDVIILTMGFATIVILFADTIRGEINKLEYELLVGLRGFLDDVRHCYYETGMIDDALFMTMDSVSYELGLHVNYFYDISIAVDPVEAIDKYMERMPNHFFLAFASNCASINEYGDSDSEGQSVFLKNLNYLKESIGDELLHLGLVRMLFSGLVTICLLPVFLIKPLESWVMSVFEDLSAFYQGKAGVIVVILICALSFIFHQMIIAIKGDSKAVEANHQVLDMLLGNRTISRLTRKYNEANVNRTIRIEDMLKRTGDNIGTRRFFLKRICFGMMFFLLINLVMLTSLHDTLKTLRNDFSHEFTSSLIPGEEYRTVMRQVAGKYMSIYEKTHDDAIIEKMITEDKLEPVFAEMIFNSIKERFGELNKNGYSMDMFLFAVTGGILGYFIPYLMLLYKVKLSGLDKENELEQFQTMALILRNMDGITVNVVLEWLVRFANCFRDNINRCIIALEKSETEALEELRNEPYKPFSYFVDCLIAIDKTGIVNAFEPIEQERTYNREKRRQERRNVLERKARLCKMIAFIPTYATFLGYLILPFAVSAMNMLKEFPVI